MKNNIVYHKLICIQLLVILVNSISLSESHGQTVYPVGNFETNQLGQVINVNDTKISEYNSHAMVEALTVTQAGSISGIAYDSQTGQPISQLNITLKGDHMGDFMNVRTNYLGQYQFSNLAADTYYIFSNGYVTDQGKVYLYEYFENAANYNSMTPIVLGDSSGVNGIDLEMNMGGKITGYVYENDGSTPIKDMAVYIIWENHQNWSVRTDASGYYSQGGLGGHTYRLWARGDNIHNGKFYNNVSTEGDAATFSITAPEVLSNINFRLEKNKGYISGAVYDATNGLPVPNKTLEIAGYLISNVVKTNSSGIYSSPPLNAGEYKVYSRNESGYQYEFYQDKYTTNDATIVRVDLGKTTTVDMTIYNPASVPRPVSDFSGSPKSGKAPLTAKFTSNSTGVINSYLWNFGDGNTSYNHNPSHLYVKPGIYTVSLRVEGPGGSDTAVKQNYITVLATAPVAGFRADTTWGYSPLGVQFTGLSSGSIDSLLWDFGDGKTSTEVNPFHEYQYADSFTISLCVEGPGGRDMAIKQNYITVLEKVPVAGFRADTTWGYNSLGVHFTGLSSGSIDSLLWDFGDGKTSTEVNPFHEYQYADSFTVSLRVEGPGGRDMAIKQNYITVLEKAPVAGFCADTTRGYSPLGVQFTDTSSGSIDSLLWDFGDGGTSTEINPFHEYQYADSFIVSLRVEGPGGCDTAVKTNYITVLEKAPVAGFYADTTRGYIPLGVQFTDTSSGSIDAWRWDFGDGQSSTEHNPLHTYETADSFIVSLTVTGPGGSDIETKEDYIILLDPSGISGKEEQLPVSFALSQNYPNPFNPSTRIEYAVKEPCKVNLIIYNLNGQAIQELIDSYQQPGKHFINLNMHEISSGIYLYKIQMGDFQSVKKMVKIE